MYMKDNDPSHFLISLFLSPFIFFFYLPGLEEGETPVTRTVVCCRELCGKLDP
jgi:hypothetical protein